MNTTTTRGALASALTAFALLVAPAALGQPGGMPRGTDYVNGGVTKEEADELRAQARAFPLEIQFARRMDVGNAFAADVRVRIVDARGATVLDIPSADPILLANVPPGRYTIEATLDGQTKRQTVNVGRGHAQTTFVW
jgi:hypothetical protein